MTAHTYAANEELVSTATHLLNLTLNDLLHVGKALRLKQVLSLGVPGAASSLVALFNDDRPLDTDHVHEFIESEQFVRSFDKESVDVLLRILSVVMKEDESGLARVDKATIRRGHRLEDDIVTDVMLEETILSDGFSRFFSAHFSMIRTIFL